MNTYWSRMILRPATSLQLNLISCATQALAQLASERFSLHSQCAEEWLDLDLLFLEILVSARAHDQLKYSSDSNDNLLSSSQLFKLLPHHLPSGGT